MSNIKAAYLRTQAADYASRFIGTPYLWGGDDPMDGFDCSGLVLEVLQAHGVFERGRDYTAHGIREQLIGRGCPEITGLGYAGCIVFWPGGNNRMGHVAIMVDNEHIVHAAGGGSAVDSLDDAKKFNAYIRKDRVDYRGDGYIIVDPFLGNGE
jgi:cell wall-associated NlpC family hydrolase